MQTSNHQRTKTGRFQARAAGMTFLAVIWWPMAGALMDYLARCSYMLRQGWFVADVCYYYGDQAPNFHPPSCNVPEKPLLDGLAPGNDYDVCSSEVILGRMRLEQGRIVLPDGMSYAALVLPEQDHIPANVLAKIHALVTEGATVIGHQRPTRSPGLKDQESETAKVLLLAGELWGQAEMSAKQDTSDVLIRPIKKGRFIVARDRTAALRKIGVAPDFEIAGYDKSDLGPLDFVHRQTTGEDSYFIYNRTAQAQVLTCRFRAATGSVFVVFRKSDVALDPIARDSFVAAASPTPMLVEGPWHVAFPEGWGAPPEATFDTLQSWTESDNEGIRFFSVMATYRKSIEIPEPLAKQDRLFLELGDLAEIAELPPLMKSGLFGPVRILAPERKKREGN